MGAPSRYFLRAQKFNLECAFVINYRILVRAKRVTTILDDFLSFMISFLTFLAIFNQFSVIFDNSWLLGYQAMNHNQMIREDT